MTRYHGPFRWMSNFKAVAIDYEYYLTLSDKPQSVCLTERQMYVLSVQNTYTAWLTRWYNTDDITQKTVQFIAAEIEELLMCGCGVPVPSITDVLNAQTYTTNTATSYITTYNTWNDAGQTVISIAPNLDYGSGVPADIDKMMCLGLNMLLVAIVEQAKAIKQGEIDDAKDITKQLASAFGSLGVAAGAATGVGGAAAAFVGYLGGPWLLLGLGLAAVGLTIASIVIPADLSVFTDEVAFNDVYCTMVNNLVGNQPTRAAFQAALTPNSFAPGSLAAQLAAVVQPYLDDLDMYLQFLVQMNGLYEVSNFTLLPECNCVPGTWCKLIDFRTMDASIFDIDPNIEAPGVPAFLGYEQVLGVGLKRNPASDADRTFGHADWSAYTVTKTTMTWSYVDTSGSGNTYSDNDFGAPHPTTYPLDTLTNEFVNPLFNFIFGGDRAGFDVTPFINIETLYVEGTGTKPPWADYC